MNHPNSQLPWAQWSEDQTLHVAVAYSNPFRWQTRRELANDTIRHLSSCPNVRLYVGELAYGDRPHEIVEHPGVELIRRRTAHELWHKENILNRVITHFGLGWKYGAWVDADFHFTRHDWALETIHQLQHYDFVQPFSSYTDLGASTYGQAHRPTRVNASFAYNYVQSGYRLPEGYANGGWRKLGLGPDAHGYEQAIGVKGRGVGATGGAWAFRRTALDAVGGLMDKRALGHADWLMTFGLVGEEAPDTHITSYTEDYRNYIYDWQKNAARLKKNIGYTDCFAVHHFHGSKERRAYSTRDLILVQNGFSPYKDLRMDYQGIYQLTPDKPKLRDDIRAYFISRSEDDPNLYGKEKPMI